MYWRYRKYSQNDAKFSSLSGISTGLVNLNVKHTSKGATRADKRVLGQKAVEIHGSGEPYKKVLITNPVYSFETSAFLDQLVELGIDVSEHHRKQRIRQYNALYSIEY